MIRFQMVVTALAVVLAMYFARHQPQPLLCCSRAPRHRVACGMTLVIICRQIDISVGSVFSVCSVCTGLLAARGWPLPLVLPAAAALGALLGAMNGLLVARLRLPSIVVTLATMVALRQGLNLVRQGEFVNMQDAVQWFGGPQATGQWLLVGASLALLVVLGLGLRHLAAGRFVYAVGTDAEAARLAVFRPQLVPFLVFVFIGALTGLAR